MEKNKKLGNLKEKPKFNKKIKSTKKTIHSLLSKQNINEIAIFVIDQIHKWLKPITFGWEWEIYKVNFNWKDFIVAKKLFKNTWSNEFKTHKKSFNIMKKEEIFENVSIPEPYLYTTDWKDEYIIMEYIYWPTLYARIIEKIIENETRIQIRCYDDKSADFNLVKIFWIQKAKEIIMNLTNNPLQYKKHKIFSKDEWKVLFDSISVFLETAHKNGIYHRDIWGNIRNIIIKDDLKSCVIDFWKSICLNCFDEKLNENEIINEDEIYFIEENWIERKEYARDEEILEIIKAFSK